MGMPSSSMWSGEYLSAPLHCNTSCLWRHQPMSSSLGSLALGHVLELALMLDTC